jgi:ribose transport system permease protein
LPSQSVFPRRTSSVRADGVLRRHPGRRLQPLVPVVVLIALCMLITAANPRFLTWLNLVRIAASAAVPLVLSLGLTVVVLLGSIDLSIEGTMAIGSIVLSLLVANDVTGFRLGWLALPITLAATALVGAGNGLVHVWFRIPSFMVTLGTWFIGLGIAAVVLGGGTVRILDPQIRGLALARFLGLPWLIWVAVGALISAWVIQNYTRLGRHMYAVGGDENLAALSGIRIRRVKVAAFALAGAFYGLASVLEVAQLGQANAVSGEGRLFTTVTAVVVGGTSLTGGIGGPLNSLVGVLIVVVLANGMILIGVSPYLQTTIQGLMIIVAMAIGLDRRRMGIVK